MSDMQSWLLKSVNSAKFFLHDLTRKDSPDIIAVTEQSDGCAKGVIVRTSREADLGAQWWTICDDVQAGLEMGYFDISKECPCLEVLCI